MPRSSEKSPPHSRFERWARRVFVVWVAAHVIGWIWPGDDPVGAVAAPVLAVVGVGLLLLCTRAWMRKMAPRRGRLSAWLDSPPVMFGLYFAVSIGFRLGLGWSATWATVAAVVLAIGGCSVAAGWAKRRWLARQPLREEPKALWYVAVPGSRRTDVQTAQVPLRVVGALAGSYGEVPVGVCGEQPEGEYVLDVGGFIVRANGDESVHPGSMPLCYKPVGHRDLHTWQRLPRSR